MGSALSLSRGGEGEPRIFTGQLHIGNIVKSNPRRHWHRVFEVAAHAMNHVVLESHGHETVKAGGVAKTDSMSITAWVGHRATTVANAEKAATPQPRRMQHARPRWI